MTLSDPTPPLLECDRLAKVFCVGFEQGRRYALRDILRVGARRGDRLRAGERVAVRDFSVTVRAGENVVVLGTAAAGKTTIAKLLVGMLRANAGRVHLRGRVGLIVGGKLGMNPFLTVWEYVQLVTSIHGAEPRAADACCEEVLEITGLSDRRDTRLVDLRSGVRYLSLAAALVVPQDLRIFDGLPAGGDDPVGRRVAARAGQLLEAGSNLILSSTTAGLPSRLSHGIILHDGETLYEGRPETVVPIFDEFVYRMRRAAKVAEQRPEPGAVAAPPPPPSPADLIRRAAGRLDGSKTALLVEDRVAQAWCGDHPVILGPYLSDVGFELLYWRPFVAWMRDRFGPRAQPVVAVSRGRIDDWYAGLVSEYVDVCDLAPLATVRERNLERIRDGGTVKQTVISDFEQELVDAVARRLGSADSVVLHPSVIFRVCSKIWSGAVPAAWLEEHARYPPFVPPPPARPEGDEPYAAVSFWFNSCFPDTPAHRRVVDDVVGELSRRLRVVVLDVGGLADRLPSLGTADRVRVLTPSTDTDDQLREQSRTIAGAQAFIGTFGGVSLIAPFYDVPTLTVFGQETGLFPFHAAVSRRVASSLPDVRFDTLKTTELDPARLASWIDQALP